MSNHVVFLLGGQRFAVGADRVVEIVRAVKAAAVPLAPVPLEGIIDFHGRFVPVLDVRARFGLPPKTVELTDRLVVARAGAREVALRVDAVEDVVALAPTPFVAITPAAGAAPLAGVARAERGVILIHDLEAFLSEAEGQVLDAAVAAAEAAR